MQISKKNARHLAKYLSKGIFEHPGTQEVSISIGEDASIGIVRRGRKFILCIKYRDIIQKEDMRSGFNENISEDDLANLVIDVIENSSSLLEVELNMDKVPLLHEENAQGTNQENPEKHDVIPEAAPTDALRQSHHRKADPDPDTNAKSADSGQASPHREDEPAASPPDDKGSEKEIPETIIPEDSADDDAEPSAPADSAKEPTEDLSVKDSLHLPTADSTPYETKEENTMITSENKVETAIQAKGLLPSLTDTSRFADTSYISSLLGDASDIQNKFMAVFSEIANMDRELAVEFYIRGLYALLPLMGNDIDAVAEATGVDKRDIVLSIYERQLF